MADEAKTGSVHIDVDTDDPGFMGQFLANKKVVEDTIAQLGEETNLLQELQDRAAVAVDPGEESAISKDLKSLIKRVNKSSRNAQTILKKMAAENKQFKKARKRAKAKAREEGVDFIDEHAHVLRIREQTLNSLTRSMVEAMRRHQLVKTESAEKAKEKCLRRAKLVWPDMDEEELAQRVNDNPTGMFSAGVQQTANARMRRAYDEARDTAKDVERLQRSIQELYEMFMDLASLVHKQGETLNSIETSVNAASTYVKKGNKELVKAHKYQKKQRKCMCCLLIIGVAVICIFAVSAGVLLGA